MTSIYEYLRPALPKDHSRQTSALDVVKDRVKNGFAPTSILDVGCGLGKSRGQLLSFIKGATWTGVDIEGSPEVNAREGRRDDLVTFDGVHLPVENGIIDLVYSFQVFEHVRYPEKLLADIARVLSLRGLFIGQTSQLEPYHSRSIFNYTPYGWKLICEDAGLEIVELRPGIDGITLIERTAFGKSGRFNRWFIKESPINQRISKVEKSKGTDNELLNLKKLNVSGQFCFVARRSPQRS